MSGDNRQDNNANEVEILAQERELVLDHDYDGIKELDHPLPLWWTFLFVGTIVFSIPYYFYYTHADGPGAREELAIQMERIQKLQDDYAAKAGGFDVDKFNAFVATPEARKMGKETYDNNCAACHGREGEGLIGPNLTDNYWVHGDGKLLSVYDVIAAGVPAKGMPAWKQTLNEEQMMAVTDYVLKFKGQNLPGKAPEGELIED